MSVWSVGVYILKGKAVFLSFPCPLYGAVVNESDAMLGEQRHLPLNMKLWIIESHLAYKGYYNLFITHGNILLHIIITLPFYVNSIYVPLSSEKDAPHIF